MEEPEYDLKDALAKLAAEEEQNLANLVSMGRQVGAFYKSLRRNSVPRGLAQEITHEFFHAIMGMSTLHHLLDEVNDND